MNLVDRFRRRLARELDELCTELGPHPDLVLAVPIVDDRLRDEDPDRWVQEIERQSELNRFFEEQGLARAVQSVSRQFWPDGVPLPLHAGEALAILEDKLPSMAAEVANHVDRAVDALVAPELQRAVLARSRVVEQWPWPTGDRDVIEDPNGRRWLGPVGNPGWVVLEQITRENPSWSHSGGTHFVMRTTGPVEVVQRTALIRVDDPQHGQVIGRMRWPGEVAPLSVATWARDGMNRLAADAGDKQVQMVERGDLPFSLVWLDESERRMLLPAYGIALLYLAEHEVRKGLRRRALPVPAGKPHHDLITGMRDVPRDGRRHSGAPADLTKTTVGEVAHIGLFIPGEPLQLELMDDGNLHGPVIRQLRGIRGAKGLRHWAAFLRLWGVEGGRLGWVRWTLDEHMTAMGYSNRQRQDPPSTRHRRELVAGNRQSVPQSRAVR